VRFEEEITKLFQRIKVDAQRHIKDVKSSFSDEYYDLMRSKLRDNFNYANVKYALAEMERFKHI
jgi:hypothetical protein